MKIKITQQNVYKALTICFFICLLTSCYTHSRNNTLPHNTNSYYDQSKHSPLDKWKMDTGVAIQKNWNYDNNKSKLKKNIEVKIRIDILKNGQVEKITYVAKSGDEYLDQSAMDAIKKSNPFNEIPGDHKSSSLVIIFEPGD